MKTTMKKTAAYLLALLLVFQMIPAFADSTVSAPIGSIPAELYRDKLAVTSDAYVLLVGSKAQLSATEGYDSLIWTSDHPEIAAVDENGQVTAVAAGTAKITAKEGQFSDSITIRVIEAEKSEGKQGADEEKMIIVINAVKAKITYDGEYHDSGFTATSNSDSFNPGNVRLVNRDAVVSQKDCGVYTVHYEASDFVYDGVDSNQIEFIVSDGWMQIKPLSVTVKANDATMFAGGSEPEFTATVTGVLEGEDPSQISYTFETLTQDGVTYIIPVADQIQGNYRVTAEKGILTIATMVDAPLYNLAHFENNNAYYRLAKTTFKTSITDITKAYSHKLTAEEYVAEPYDFEDLVITNNKKEYVFCCDKNADKIAAGANYYTVTLDVVEAVKNKIGGMNGSTPRWMVPESERYTDKNETDSFHRNYTIHLHQNNSVPQEAYTMLSVNGNSNYYRLRMSSITTRSADSMANGTKLSEGEYVLTPYDFTNVVITIDGEEYRYSDHELEGEYDNYYTVTFQNVEKTDRINRSATWYKDEAGWLDNSKELYEGLPNETPALHANYKATTHKGVRRDRSVRIESDWPAGKKGYVGARITLTAYVTGFNEGEYTLQWQYSVNGEDWNDQPGANGETYTYTLNEITTHYTWRVMVYDVD